ncbi:HutD/Ves family protein [Pseudarthrobacter raffinosi]|uniref:HutD/Ves family protein n=1 Tax=Pseudarthrobacter raffinosi TaxID=2953651 RepID=UPI00208FF9A3|nr:MULTISPECIES: HutD family protein [unclassified Pseudarthrobacter]MCO4236776.1 HutD family protein [Pseudarthrobacter sp. MDT3-28]MCO4263532.1 HutD family protein [Pseudarthrobacter sp. MDT3-26]
MEIIRFAELRSEPWRNGGGVTRELASHPKAASAQDGAWDWRVSIADVSKAGDFSAFPGMERVLTVIDGELLLLTVDGAEHPLEKYRPFRFSGEAAAHGALPTGDIRDLNVITRTGSFKGFTSIIELSKKRAHPVFEGQLAVLLQGQAAVSAGSLSVSAEAVDAVEAAAAPEADADEAAPVPGEPEALNRYDAVVGSDTGTPEILGRGFLAVVSIDRVTA